MAADEPLRFLSYIWPVEVIHSSGLAAHLQQSLNRRIEFIEAESGECSAPSAAQLPEVMSAVDLAVFCSPTLVEYRARKQAGEPCVEFLAAPAPGGKPQHSESVLVRREDADALGKLQSVLPLAGLRLAFNDRRSLSGYLAIKAAVQQASGESLEAFFASSCASGSHLNSIRQLVAGKADVCSVDSQVLHRLAHTHADLVDQLAPVFELGPYTTQPIVASTRLPLELRERARAAFRDVPSTVAEQLGFAFAVCDCSGAAACVCRYEDVQRVVELAKARDPPTCKAQVGCVPQLHIPSVECES